MLFLLIYLIFNIFLLIANIKFFMNRTSTALNNIVVLINALLLIPVYLLSFWSFILMCPAHNQGCAEGSVWLVNIFTIGTPFLILIINYVNCVRDKDKAHSRSNWVYSILSILVFFGYLAFYLRFIYR